MGGSKNWLYGLVGLALLSIIYSARELQWGSAPFHTFVLPESGEAAMQLVVFGDSWSDNGVYQADSPGPSQLPVKSEVRYQVWTEYLCGAVWTASTFNFHSTAN